MDLDLHDQTLGLLSLEAKGSQRSEAHTIRYALSGTQTNQNEHRAVRGSQADTSGSFQVMGKRYLADVLET